MTLPDPFSKKDLSEAVGDLDITNLYLGFINGDNEAINMLLDVVNDKVDGSTLKGIDFTRWQGKMTEIECEVLTLFVSKTRNIEKLAV